MAGGINLYAYTANNPINDIDPLGLVSSGQLGIGNLGSYGGENTCESMYDERGPLNFADFVYKDHFSDVEIQYGVIPIGPIGNLSRIKVMFHGKNIRKWERLVQKWGGRPKHWRKKKGIDEAGKEWHWYSKRGDGTKYGLKKKGDPDPF